MIKRIVILVAAWALAMPLYSETNEPNRLLEYILRDNSGEKFVALPADVEEAIAALFEAVETPRSNSMIETIQPIVNFVKKECRSGTAWSSEANKQAYGTAAMTVLTNSMGNRLELNYNVEIPDHVLYASTLRYSEKGSDHTAAHKECLAERLATNTWKMARFTNFEVNTPNEDSGAWYTYTNTKTYVRANINGSDVLCTVSKLKEPSSFSRRGAVIGDSSDVYYYSDKEGINITGLTWVKSQMFYNHSVVIHVELTSNTLAMASFSWVRAGWQNINVTRTFHIYAVLKNILNYQHFLSQSKNVTVENVCSIIKTVNTMTPEQVNSTYDQYCAYADYWSKEGQKGLGRFNPSMLARLYDSKELAAMPMEYRKALIMQEQVRVLCGKPTWSVFKPEKVSEKKGFLEGLSEKLK